MRYKNFHIDFFPFLQDDTDIVEPEIIENSIDQNTIPHFSFGSPISSTTAASLQSSTLTSNTTKGTTPLKFNVTSTTHQPKVTLNNKYSTSVKPETTSVKYVATTTTMKTESKTESSDEQLIFDRVPETTIHSVDLSKLPTTTQENIKLQTFQSVQGEL